MRWARAHHPQLGLLQVVAHFHDPRVVPMAVRRGAYRALHAALTGAARVRHLCDMGLAQQAQTRSACCVRATYLGVTWAAVAQLAA